MEEITPSKDATSAAKVLHAWRDLLEANDPKMLRASDEDLTKPRTELDGPKMHMYIHIYKYICMSYYICMYCMYYNVYIYIDYIHVCILYV